MAEPEKWPEELIYALRTTQQHHVQLSIMADNKANMLIGATFVVFTLAIGQSKAGDFSMSLLILAVTAFASAGLAAFAVMPAIKPRAGDKPNLLFFSAFSNLSEEEYIDKLLNKECVSSEATYHAMLRDIHQMGRVLERKKYRYLGWAYRVFMAGLTLSFIIYLFEQLVGPIGTSS